MTKEQQMVEIANQMLADIARRDEEDQRRHEIFMREIERLRVVMSNLAASASKG